MKNGKNDNLRMFTNRALAIGSIPLTLIGDHPKNCVNHQASVE